MEAARVAAERGASVTLLEKGDRLGGTVWFSQLTTPATNTRDVADHEIERLGVDVRLNTRADVATVGDLRPDVVVVATGAKRGVPAIPGADLPHVRTGDQLRALIAGEDGAAGLGAVSQIVVGIGRRLGVLASPARIRTLSKRWMPIGKNVVVLGGGLVGLELAEFLAERSRTVTVIEEGATSGCDGHAASMDGRWHGQSTRCHSRTKRRTRVDFDHVCSLPSW